MVECINYFYRLFCLISYTDWLLAQARCEYITDPEELKENHQRQAEMFREYLYENKNIKKTEMWRMRQSKELDFPESASILRELCTFNSATDSFIYTAPKQHPNALFKFSHNANLEAN